MPGQRKRRKFTEEKKNAIVAYANKHGPMKAMEKFQLSGSQIYSWGFVGPQMRNVRDAKDIAGRNKKLVKALQKMQRTIEKLLDQAQ